VARPRVPPEKVSASILSIFPPGPARTHVSARIGPDWLACPPPRYGPGTASVRKERPPPRYGPGTASVRKARPPVRSLVSGPPPVGRSRRTIAVTDEKLGLHLPTVRSSPVEEKISLCPDNAGIRLLTGRCRWDLAVPKQLTKATRHRRRAPPAPARSSRSPTSRPSRAPQRFRLQAKNREHVGPLVCQALTRKPRGQEAGSTCTLMKPGGIPAHESSVMKYCYMQWRNRCWGPGNSFVIRLASWRKILRAGLPRTDVTAGPSVSFTRSRAETRDCQFSSFWGEDTSRQARRRSRDPCRPKPRQSCQAETDGGGRRALSGDSRPPRCAGRDPRRLDRLGRRKAFLHVRKNGDPAGRLV
jgi:hypothetical protein